MIDPLVLDGAPTCNLTRPGPTPPWAAGATEGRLGALAVSTRPWSLPMRLTRVLPLALLALVACGRSNTAVPVAGGGQLPGAQGQPQPTPLSAVKGLVRERIDVPPYTYLRLDTGKGEVWAAVPSTDLKVGAPASVVQAMEMRNWESPSLKRTFERVYLGQLEGASAEAGGMPKGMAQAMGQGGMHGTAPASIGDVKVPKANGADARTVAEVWAQAAGLKGRTVTVRGKVVRVTDGLTVKGVEGGTWLHVQDGSGDAQAGTHDLTVVSHDKAALGDVVVVKGTIQPDPMDASGKRVVVNGAKLTK